MGVFKPDTLRSPQLKLKKRRIAMRRLLMAGGVLAVLLAAVSALTKLDAIEIRDVATTGNAVVTEGEIEQVVEGAISGNHLKLFSKRNVFLYSREAVRDAILETYPIFASAKVGWNGLTSIAVTVAERSPSALWCRMSEGGGFTDECYFMDLSGLIYAPAPEFKGSAYLKYYGMVEGDPLGQRYLSEDRYARLAAFVEGMKPLGISPVHIEARQGDDYDVYLKQGGRIMVSGRDDLAATLINLDAIIKEDIKEGERIDYVDLRYGNKIFFKLK